MSEKIASIIEEIKGLSLLEASELVKGIEEAFGVSAAAAAVAVAPAAGGEAAEDEQTEFDVVLTGFGGNKIAVIKVVRQLDEFGSERMPKTSLSRLRSRSKRA